MTDIATTMIQDMSEDEGRRLIELERQVEKAMLRAGRDAGAALAEIHEKRLYRASHVSFEMYLLERHGLARSSGYRMIAIAKGETNGLSPEAAAIGAASARATQRRHETLDQPPTTIDPAPEPLQEAPERPEKRPQPAEPHLAPVRLPRIEPRYQPVNRPAGHAPVGRPASKEQTDKQEARHHVNRLMTILATADDEQMAAVATPVERMRIAKLGAAFTAAERAANRPEGVVDPKNCDHPVGRRIGNSCGKCGAVRKAK